MIMHRRLSAEITTLDEAQRTFLDWLGDFDAVDDEQTLCEILADCGDELPPDVCESLGLPVGSSFGNAAELFAAAWESGR